MTIQPDVDLGAFRRDGWLVLPRVLPAEQIESLRSRAVVLAEIEGGIALGADYVVVARPVAP